MAAPLVVASQVADFGAGPYEVWRDSHTGPAVVLAVIVTLAGPTSSEMGPPCGYHECNALLE